MILPNIKLNSLGPVCAAEPFLKVKGNLFEIIYPDNSKSGKFSHDTLTRKNIDASVIIANADDHIYLELLRKFTLKMLWK